MKALIFIVVFTLSNLAFAKDYKIELGFGHTEYRIRGDGTWYQDRFLHLIDNDDTSYSIGVIYKDKYRFGYEYLGKAKSFALATASDADYLDGPPYWPLSHWYGRGETRGLYFSRLFDYQYFGEEFFTELGLYAYQTKWKMTIPDWRACETCDPQFLEVEHDYKDNIQYNVLLGIGWKVRKDFSLTVNMRPVQNDGDRWPSIVKDWSYNFSIRKTF